MMNHGEMLHKTMQLTRKQFTAPNNCVILYTGLLPRLDLHTQVLAAALAVRGSAIPRAASLVCGSSGDLSGMLRRHILDDSDDLLLLLC